MAKFDNKTTSEDVFEVFGSQIKGRTFVLTGAGMPSIGCQTALTLAKGSPAHIILVSRTLEKAEPVLQKIAEIDSSIKTSFVPIELSDQDSVRQGAKEILAQAPKIDVLINSAGVMAIKEYTVDKKGIEMQLSTNHVGHFLLTNLLVPGLLAAASSSGGARVVNLTSAGYLASPFRFDDYNFSGGKTYNMWLGYAQSKTANILFSYGLTKRLASRGVTSTAVHPGMNLDTVLGSHLNVEDYAEIPAVAKATTGIDWKTEEVKNLSQIAATSLIAALDPELPAKSPAYLQDGVVSPALTHATDPDSVEKLWKLSEELVGQAFEY
ncbi:NAD(P)-binding protein [Hypoxylon fragiforme]|uniref:NAD(P)-binding protein n=1 Tax=Hypoxylon fragiforme TaxID=63214 RepID=UPI0020C6F2F5|nr:NAD(P)-binding protein [Hypoxylon fragiforme]KAI2608121.1 NAD(P)-binding protein [Hypoxylon fragiforme]